MRLISFRDTCKPEDEVELRLKWKIQGGIWINSYPHLRLFEIHHFYFGLAGILIAWLATFKVPGTWGDVVAWVLGINGLWWMGDDLFQHWRQRREPYYKSPVHRMWQWLYEKYRGGER